MNNDYSVSKCVNFENLTFLMIHITQSCMKVAFNCQTFSVYIKMLYIHPCFSPRSSVLQMKTINSAQPLYKIQIRSWGYSILIVISRAIILDRYFDILFFIRGEKVEMVDNKYPDRKKKRPFFSVATQRLRDFICAYNTGVSTWLSIVKLSDFVRCFHHRQNLSAIV